jgi:glyoxylase-like metal-dependent hydrolase (beta-lactamase superfamily II)
MAQSPPDLNIPASSSTVQVRIIDTTSHLSGLPLAPFVSPEIEGFTTFDCPAFSFLIEHSSGRKLLFDLGVRKDFENLAPRIVERIKNWKVTVKMGVREQLEQHGVNGKDVEGIIWSHWHWDHTGDPSTFEKHTALIVGPGFKKAYTPGYPTKKDSPVLDSDFEGRELREISFEQNNGLKIGNFNAFDYFGDGSFYLLDSPGHAIGHICGLARLTTSPDSFIFMGGDACHHGGEFRPSKYLPFPVHIMPNPLVKGSTKPCPGAIFEHLFRDGDDTKPFYEIARLEDGKGVAHDVDEAEATIGKVQEADAREDIFVVMAHDDSLLDVVDFFPEYANDFVKKGWVRDGKWAFLKDFRKAVKHEDA